MSKAGELVLEGLGEALRHANGEDIPGTVVHLPTVADVAAVRRGTGLSRPVFAGLIGVSLGTLRSWEEGRRAPDGPARVLLALIARNPRIVEETLAA